VQIARGGLGRQGEIGGEKSKGKRQSAKLRNPAVVGMADFIAGGRQKADLWGWGADWGLGWIGFVLGLFFLGARGGFLL